MVRNKPFITIFSCQSRETNTFKVVHHRCQAIAFMFNGGSCSSSTFYLSDTKIKAPPHLLLISGSQLHSKNAPRTIIMYYLNGENHQIKWEDLHDCTFLK